MVLSSIYSCKHCSEPIDPHANSTMHLVRGWVKGAAKTVTIENEEYVYMHHYCFEVRHLNGYQQDSLF